jgi:hypothetical protein
MDGTYYIECPIDGDCGSELCDLARGQVGSYFYHYCACPNGAHPNCHGWLRSTSPDPDDGGDDVGCFDPMKCTDEGGGDPQLICDEEQLIQGGQFVRLCVCKSLGG